MELFFLACGGARMTGKKKLPIGIDIFEKLDREEFYYVDKTGLIAGDEILKEIHQELAYNELDSSIENLWSVLFTTGYLTQRGQEGKKYRLTIPNNEIRELFILQIREWFRDVSRKDGETLNQFCEAFPEQNPEKIEEIFSDYLWNNCKVMLG